MKLTITFQNMPQSNELEAHAHEKFSKIVEFLDAERISSAQLWLKAAKNRTHHTVELHVKTPHMNLSAHDDGIDIYVAIDNTMDKLLRQIKKQKERTQDKSYKQETEKRKFSQ